MHKHRVIDLRIHDLVQITTPAFCENRNVQANSRRVSVGDTPGWIDPGRIKTTEKSKIERYLGTSASGCPIRPNIGFVHTQPSLVNDLAVLLTAIQEKFSPASSERSMRNARNIPSECSPCERCQDNLIRAHQPRSQSVANRTTFCNGNISRVK